MLEELNKQLSVYYDISAIVTTSGNLDVYRLVTHAHNHINDSIIVYLYRAEDGSYHIDEDGYLSSEYGLEGLELDEQLMGELQNRYKVKREGESYYMSTLNKDELGGQVASLVQFLTIGYYELGKQAGLRREG